MGWREGLKWRLHVGISSWKLSVIAAIEKLLGSTCYMLPQAVPTFACYSHIFCGSSSINGQHAFRLKLNVIII